MNGVRQQTDDLNDRDSNDVDLNFGGREMPEQYMPVNLHIEGANLHPEES